ncbi:DUF397 domain-containing protein [Actinomadura sp. KC216]|uniref:DUF397 domain-containing protein n=1 Tax=Actinomadura sp. KC216 TaxID=2530370 RepID=UPI001052DDAD|nr:DUF397 domain-containing protein [Actinomadura sp. KC216]TDB85141.1 DUF397 domain-containing protein [Actinomadura sp. KC216]
MDLSRASWRKASRSHDDGDQCVEVAAILDVVAIRDSKTPDGPKLIIGSSDFQQFVRLLKNL